MRISGKTILVFSPQSWDHLWISKHHYSIELSKKGNKVYFLSPPKSGVIPSVKVEKHADYEGLHIVTFRLSKARFLRHKFRRFYMLLMKRLENTLIKKEVKQIDIFWDFDINNTFYKGKLKNSSNAKRIFQPVDLNVSHKYIGERPNLILSVSNTILDNYSNIDTTTYNLGHSVSPEFFKEFYKFESKEIYKFGFAANFNKPFIDWETIIQLSSHFTNCVFYLFGPLDNVRLSENLGRPKMKQLFDANNIVFTGSLVKSKLIDELHLMDGLFVFYDRERNHNKNSNSHKILEYLMTAKPIITDIIDFYEKENNGLIEMPKGYLVEDKVLAFRQFLKSLEQLSTLNLQKKRVAYASEFTYMGQVKKVEDLLMTTT